MKKLWIFMAMVMLIPSLVGTSFGADPSQDGLVGYYKFNDNTDSTVVEDSSIYGRDGVANTDTENLDAIGRVNGAFAFNGTSTEINFSGYSGVTGTSPRTYAFWLKVDSSETVVNPIASFGESDTHIPGARCCLEVNYTSGGGAVLGAPRFSFMGGKIIGSTDLRDDRWHHVAFVVPEKNVPKSGDIKIYVDGVVETISYGAGGTVNIDTSTDQDAIIGGFHSDYLNLDWYFQGSIDEVRLYNRGLPPEMIKYLYDMGSNDYKDIVSHFTLDDSDLVDELDATTFRLNNGASITSNGKINSALDLDGTDDRATSAPLSDSVISDGVNDEWSIAFWIKTDGTPDAETVLWRPLNDDVFELTFDSSGNLDFKYDTAQKGIRVPAADISADEWHHVVVVKKSGNANIYRDFEIYLNGVKYDWDNNEYSAPTTWYPDVYKPVDDDMMLIGCRLTELIASPFTEAFVDHFDGKIDDLRIYDFALTSKGAKLLKDMPTINELRGETALVGPVYLENLRILLWYREFYNKYSTTVPTFSTLKSAAVPCDPGAAICTYNPNSGDGNADSPDMGDIYFVNKYAIDADKWGTYTNPVTYSSDWVKTIVPNAYHAWDKGNDVKIVLFNEDTVGSDDYVVCMDAHKFLPKSKSPYTQNGWTYHSASSDFTTVPDEQNIGVREDISERIGYSDPDLYGEHPTASAGEFFKPDGTSYSAGQWNADDRMTSYQSALERYYQERDMTDVVVPADTAYHVRKTLALSTAMAVSEATGKTFTVPTSSVPALAENDGLMMDGSSAEEGNQYYTYVSKVVNGADTVITVVQNVIEDDIDGELYKYIKNVSMVAFDDTYMVDDYNGSLFELFLRNYGEYDWWLDATNIPSSAPAETIAVWRRTWKCSMNKPLANEYMPPPAMWSGYASERPPFIDTPITLGNVAAFTAEYLSEYGNGTTTFGTVKDKNGENQCIGIEQRHSPKQVDDFESEDSYEIPSGIFTPKTAPLQSNASGFTTSPAMNFVISMIMQNAIAMVKTEPNAIAMVETEPNAIEEIPEAYVAPTKLDMVDFINNLGLSEGNKAIVLTNLDKDYVMLKVNLIIKNTPKEEKVDDEDISFNTNVIASPFAPVLTHVVQTISMCNLAGLVELPGVEYPERRRRPSVDSPEVIIDGKGGVVDDWKDYSFKSLFYDPVSAIQPFIAYTGGLRHADGSIYHEENLGSWYHEDPWMCHTIATAWCTAGFDVNGYEDEHLFEGNHNYDFDGYPLSIQSWQMIEPGSPDLYYWVFDQDDPMYFEYDMRMGIYPAGDSTEEEENYERNANRPVFVQILLSTKFEELGSGGTVSIEDIESGEKTEITIDDSFLFSGAPTNGHAYFMIGTELLDFSSFNFTDGRVDRDNPILLFRMNDGEYIQPPVPDDEVGDQTEKQGCTYSMYAYRAEYSGFDDWIGPEPIFGPDPEGEDPDDDGFIIIVPKPDIFSPILGELPMIRLEPIIMNVIATE